LLQRASLGFFILICLFLACGKRGDPTPPIPIIPQAVSDLTAVQQGTTVVLSWTYPSLTTAGRALKSIERIEVYRHVEPLPPSLAGKALEKATDVPVGMPLEVALFREVRPLAPQQFLKLKETLETIERDELAGLTVGVKLLLDDNPPIRTPDQRPVRITYAVVTEAEERSDLSNLAVIVPLDVPRAPRSLRASVAPEAVTLTWEPPEETLTGADDPPIAGYNIYRFGAEAPPSDLGSPVNAPPVEGTTFRDTPPYGLHRYAVTAVRSIGPPLLQSVTSNVVPVEFRDLLAPPIPTGLTALPEENSVRLLWDAVEAPDLAGYMVYRKFNNIWLRITPEPITETFLRDEPLAPLTPYSFAVSSIDQLGNESLPAVVDDVVIHR
jgi:hypothetical protein